jgi:putative ABC transport system permease protein
MNIMLVTVAERTREIGLLKSLGYSEKDVLSLFIIESIIVGLIGGILGTILGIGVAMIANSLLGVPNIFPLSLIFLGFSVSVLVGLFAGVYPARKAARMNPVEALRKE